jgi:predicted transcriptional regulator
MEEHVQHALEIVKAQASVRNMTEEEINSMVNRIASQLKEIIGNEGSPEQAQEGQKPAIDPKKAIRENSVVCLECGKKFKVLSKRHLAAHGLTPQEYREKWGFKKNTSMIAKSLARQRRKKMQEMQIWKKRQSQ